MKKKKYSSKRTILEQAQIHTKFSLMSGILLTVRGWKSARAGNHAQRPRVCLSLLYFYKRRSSKRSQVKKKAETQGMAELEPRAGPKENQEIALGLNTNWK